MAIPEEERIMREIGLGQHYSYFNGSGSCAYIRREAIDNLPTVLKKHGYKINSGWHRLVMEADRVDGADGESTLTNVWIMCSYAIQDAIYRKSGNGFDAPENPSWYFWSDEIRNRYYQDRGFSLGNFFNEVWR
jgi:hypothetical protein